MVSAVSRDKLILLQSEFQDPAFPGQRVRARLVGFATLVLALVATLLTHAAAADISVATSGAFTAAYLELLPQLERVTNDKVVTAATSIGAGADSIPSRLQRGEPIDVVIVSERRSR